MPQDRESGPMQYLLLLLKAMRPKQWIKNLLVAAAPIAAGDFFNEVDQIILGVAGFISASIIGYLVNDWLDQEADRLHQRKKFRPFASKQLKSKSFILLLVLNSIFTSSICFVLPREYLYAILAYLLVTISYSLYMKKKPVVEMLWLATGFLIRALAGSTIIQESPTGWFVVSVWFGALFIVSAKRVAELKQNQVSQTRQVINKYNQSFLDLVLTSSVSITLLTYSLWVFQVHPESIVAQFTILPFALSVFLYSWHCENGDAESPETLITVPSTNFASTKISFTDLISPEATSISKFSFNL
jgi:decaprenyl-phosphate phosphoribosyltransferase